MKWLSCRRGVQHLHSISILEKPGQVLPPAGVSLAACFRARCELPAVFLEGWGAAGSSFASSHLVCVFASSSAIHPCVSG